MYVAYPLPVSLRANASASALERSAPTWTAMTPAALDAEGDEAAPDEDEAEGDVADSEAAGDRVCTLDCAACASPRPPFSAAAEDVGLGADADDEAGDAADAVERDAAVEEDEERAPPSGALLPAAAEEVGLLAAVGDEAGGDPA